MAVPKKVMEPLRDDSAPPRANCTLITWDSITEEIEQQRAYIPWEPGCEIVAQRADEITNDGKQWGVADLLYWFASDRVVLQTVRGINKTKGHRAVNIVIFDKRG